MQHQASFNQKIDRFLQIANLLTPLAKERQLLDQKHNLETEIAKLKGV